MDLSNSHITEIRGMFVKLKNAGSFDGRIGCLVGKIGVKSPWRVALIPAPDDGGRITIGLREDQMDVYTGPPTAALVHDRRGEYVKVQNSGDQLNGRIGCIIGMSGGKSLVSLLASKGVEYDNGNEGVFTLALWEGQMEVYPGPFPDSNCDKFVLRSDSHLCANCGWDDTEHTDVLCPSQPENIRCGRCSKCDALRYG